MMRTARNVSRVLALLALLAAVATATTLQRMSLDELAASSPAVARARCMNTASRWEGGHIWTFTDFEVLESLKGNLPGRIQVRLVGGKVGGLHSTVEGVPRFAPGEEAYLFLARAPAGDWTVTGWALGTFRIAREKRSGRETVTQDAAGVSLFDPATRQFRAGSVRRMDGQEFRRQLDAAIERSARGKP
jgi:hypothetical protein